MPPIRSNILFLKLCGWFIDIVQALLIVLQMTHISYFSLNILRNNIREAERLSKLSVTFKVTDSVYYNF